MLYTLYNNGNTLTFRANDRVYWTPASRNPEDKETPKRALEFYKEFVKFRNDPAVFILDKGGKQILEF